MNGAVLMPPYTAEASARLDRYLQEVRAALARSPDVNPDEIEADIRDHVATELRNKPHATLTDLERVLAQLGPPEVWAPTPQRAPTAIVFDPMQPVRAVKAWVRGMLNALWRGPDDWRLAYLTFLLFWVGLITAPIVIGIPMLIASYFFARAASGLAKEKNTILGARKWLIYPPIVLVSVPLLLAVVFVPIVAAPATMATVHELADGNNGDADKIEILDQLVRATYVLKGCKAAAPNQCQVRAELPIGPNRQRIKVCFHLFRTTVGGAAGVGGVTEQNLRRRTFKWYRRAYAQAELAPKLVAPFIEMIDPPAANMLVLSNDHGNPASGLDTAATVSTLSFTLDLAPPVAGPPSPAQNVSINLTAGDTPTQVGAAIIAALPAGFTGQAFTNAPAFNAVNGSVDLIITRADGRRMLIRSETTTDTTLSVTVARVNLTAVNPTSPGPAIIPASIDFRRVIRAAPGADDRMDCYVIGQFSTPGLRGRAFVAATDLPAGFQPPSPLRWATVMAANSGSGTVMDGTDNLPFTYPHESGHVLLDAFHTTGTLADTELMSGSGTSQANSLTATKRLCDDPVHVQYAMFQPQPAPTTGAATTQAISAVQRLRARGALVMEGW